jgi:hypothetical protein
VRVVPRPSVRTWLKNTRLPGLRTIVQFARAVRRLHRLQQLAETVERLEAHSRALVGQFADRAVAANPRSDSTDSTLTRRLDEFEFLTTARYHHLYRQLDLLKSSLEIPRDWFDEFRRWKRENALPATPLVSVCVATWNRGRILTERCLPSILNQSYRHIEVVVVGDCCTDDTAARVDRLNDPRVRFVNLPERGRYPAERSRRWQVAGSVPMNAALGLCTGDYVTHLDDDDEYEPSRVEKLVNFAGSRDLDLVWHPFWYEPKPGHWELCPADELRLTQVTTSSILYRGWLSRIVWDTGSHFLDEPGDWNRVRKFLFLGVSAARFSEPLLRHHIECNQSPT